jgi:hypothetical protein
MVPWSLGTWLTLFAFLVAVVVILAALRADRTRRA